MAAVACLLAVGQARAQGEGWYSRQHNAIGQWCCTGADGHIYDGAYTINKDGSVTIPVDGGTLTIEAGKVLPYNPGDPNPTGQAVMWYFGTLAVGLEANVYCLALGPLV